MNDIDHLLHDAFDSVRVPGDIRPHLGDVRTRARRMHRRRTTGMVGAFAMLGAAGVGLQSLRHDARTALTPGDGGVDLGLGNDASSVAPTTSVDCGIAIAPTTIGVVGAIAPLTVDTPLPQSAPVVTSSYEIQTGDTPMGVAQRFSLTLDELKAANEGNAGFRDFLVGVAIAVPETTIPLPTTLVPEDPTTSWGGNAPYPAQCAPGYVDTGSTDVTVTTVTYMGSGQPPAEPAAGTTTTTLPPDTVCSFDQPPVYCDPETTVTVLNG